MRSMFPPASAMAAATEPNSSGPTPIPITVTTDIGRVGVGRVVDLLELDVEATLPSEEEKISDRGPFAGDPDEHVEGETAPDDYLLDVVDLDLGLGQDRHQPGRDPRAIRTMDRDEDRRVFSHRPSG